MKISIRLQIFIAFLSVVLLMSAVFTLYGLYSNINSIRSSIDERLRVAANGVAEILPEYYHMRLLAGDISDTEYKALQAKLKDYKNRVGISRLYSIVEVKKGEYCFSLAENHLPFTPCLETEIDFSQIFETRKMQITQGVDSDYSVISRVLLLPIEVSDGRMFVIGADLNVDIFRPMIIKSLLSFLTVMLSGIIMVVVVTLLVSRRISSPIRSLSGFAKKLADSDFSEHLNMDAELSPLEIKTNEVALLADNIKLMRSRLADYLGRIEKEAEARQAIEGELRLAGNLQMSFLPGTNFEFEDISVSAFLKTARESGGDLYDFFVLPSGRLFFTIGDVSGKGISAALFMARAISLIRSAAHIFKDLNSMVELINRELCSGNEICTFLTLFVATYDAETNEIKFINCGHNPPFLKRADGSAEMVKMKPNFVLGVFEDAKFETQTFSLNKGETLVCYTDGVTEAISADSTFYGEERLRGLLQKNYETSAAYTESIVRDVALFSENCEQADDITLLVLGKK